MKKCEQRTAWSRRGVVAVLTAGLLVLGAGQAGAQPQADTLSRVALTQRVGESVPLELTFRDEAGRLTALRELMSDRPVILVPVFYRCPMLCTQVLNALLRAVQELTLSAGSDYEVIVFSIDARETPTLAAQKKLAYLRHVRDPAMRAGWHFLTGEREAIDRLCEAIGYRYAYDAARDQFAHPAAAVILTPDGRISRYVVGLDYSPRDLRLSLVESSEGRIGSVVDRVLLRCYAYDPASGRYGFAVMNALRIGGALTLLGLAGLVGFLRRRHAGRVDAEREQPQTQVPR